MKNLSKIVLLSIFISLVSCSPFERGMKNENSESLDIEIIEIEYLNDSVVLDLITSENIELLDVLDSIILIGPELLSKDYIWYIEYMANGAIISQALIEALVVKAEVQKYDVAILNRSIADVLILSKYRKFTIIGKEKISYEYPDGATFEHFPYWIYSNQKKKIVKTTFNKE